MTEFRVKQQLLHRYHEYLQRHTALDLLRWVRLGSYILTAILLIVAVILMVINKRILILRLIPPVLTIIPALIIPVVASRINGEIQEDIQGYIKRENENYHFADSNLYLTYTNDGKMKEEIFDITTFMDLKNENGIITGRQVLPSGRTKPFVILDYYRPSLWEAIYDKYRDLEVD